jgi:hypothetical protein
MERKARDHKNIGGLITNGRKKKQEVDVDGVEQEIARSKKQTSASVDLLLLPDLPRPEVRRYTEIEEKQKQGRSR